MDHMPPSKRKPKKASELEENDTTVQEGTTEVTTATDTEPETTDTEGPQITLGVSAPKRTRNGAGRKRGDNPFDDIMQDLYESGEWASVPFSSEDQENKLRNQLKNAAQHAGYGLDLGVDEDEPGVLKFHVREKVQGRGRKPGTKKASDGKFYGPDDELPEGVTLPGNE